MYAIRSYYADKLLHVGWPYDTVSTGVLSTGLFILLLFFLVARRDRRRVCYLVDRNAGLKNLVTSGVDAGGQPCPAARVVERRAREQRQDPSSYNFV